MLASPGHPNIEVVLVTKRYEILDTFVRRVRRLELARSSVSAADIARPMAACLTWMARTLAGLHGEGESARVACEYADERRRMGYELPAILTELGLFRASIVEIAADAGIRDLREIERVSSLLHRFLSDAVTRASATRTVGAAYRASPLRRTR